MNPEKKKKIFAVASLGGHWKQLLRITKPLEEKYEVVYVSTHPKCSTMVDGNHFYVMNDFNRKNAWRLVPEFFRILRIMRQEHPDAVLSTGAAPGLVCLLVGRFLHCKTIWVDSMANVARLSVCGRIARWFVSRTYTQWPDLVKSKEVYAGSVWDGEK